MIFTASLMHERQCHILAAAWLWAALFQLILNPTRDWNYLPREISETEVEFQLILNPTRDWNRSKDYILDFWSEFQLILNPTRDWNSDHRQIKKKEASRSN